MPFWALGKIHSPNVKLKGSGRVVGTTESHDVRDILVDRLFKDVRNPKAEAEFRELFGRVIDGAGVGTPGSRPRNVFEELTSHNNDQLDALRKAQEDNTRQTNDYVKAQLDQINQLNAGFMKQIEDMRASHAAEMASYRQKNDATISGLNQSFQNQIAGRDQAFQNELAMRDKRDMLRAQATNMALMKERAKNKRGEFSSATMLSNPASMSGLLLGRNSLLGL